MAIERIQSLQSKLAKAVDRLTYKNGIVETAISELTLYRLTEESQTFYEVWSPGVCLIASGSKRILFGNNSIQHDSSKYLLLSADLPLTTYPLGASDKDPYLALRIDLDPSVIMELVIESEMHLKRIERVPHSLNVNPLSERLLEVILRLIDLLEKPHDIRIVKPLILKELAYILLSSEHGAQLQALAIAGSQSQKINKVINKIKLDYKSPFKISELAALVSMSESSLHHYFKSITSMTPLQFQKQLRLQEARRLMFKYNYDASTAAYEVGYGSTTQFNREYKRFFGDTPIHDVTSKK